LGNYSELNFGSRNDSCVVVWDNLLF